MFKFFLYKLGSFLVNALPLDLSYKLGIFLSDMQCTFSPRDQRAVRNNLRIILGANKDLPRLTREVFRNFGRYLVEFFRMDTMVNQEFLKNMVIIENKKYLDQCLSGKKGGIILTAHIGNWELGSAVLNLLGQPIMAIALPHKERPVNDLFNRQRQSIGSTVVPMQNSVRRSIETLKNNGLIGLVADRDFTMNGEELMFFGRKTLIPKGAAIFSCKTGAPILPTFLLREPDNTFKLIFGEPLYPPVVTDGTIDDKIVLGIMEKYKRIIEQKIREYPTQWLMFRKFWIK